MINQIHLDPKSGTGTGNFSSLKAELDLTLEPNPDFKPTEINGDTPSHFVYATARGGKLIRIGSAWTKTVQNGANRGARFLSISVDDPSFDDTLSFQAFMESKPAPDGPAVYEVRWRRPRERE